MTARRKVKPETGQTSFIIERETKALAVPAIRAALAEWRQAGYPDVSETTRTLLNFWFHRDHKVADDQRFRYYCAQQEAVESLVYVYEVARTRRLYDLYMRFIPAEKRVGLPMPAWDDFARYCVKMATGSGKTKVMALAIAWQYFNAVRENDADYARTFLVIAPNVIVFERLRGDFADGSIFKNDPIIPKEFQSDWEMQFYMRGDAERASSEGALYLTNIQQLYERDSRKKDDEPAIMTAMLGAKPAANLSEEPDFRERIIERADSPLLVLNDEAHHTHDPKSAWNETIRALHQGHAAGLAGQLDFTATPRHQKGALFSWVISDYPLEEAIRDGIVKRPWKGSTDIGEFPSNEASRRYESYLVAGVERWREYREQLAPMCKKPLLFIMMNDTREADDVGAYLQRKYPTDFAGEKTLIIHTKRNGDIVLHDLDAARKAAKEVDEGSSPINAIVSVLMLRKGWDVQNVTVIIGLRPYSAEANILPEQTIGRGLRLMFRGLPTSYEERVDVIGNPAFINFVEELKNDEDYEFDTWRVGKDQLQITVIKPEPDKAEYDTALPTLSPILARTSSLQEEIEAIDIASLYSGEPLPITASEDLVRTFLYQGKDLLTSETLFERIHRIDHNCLNALSAALAQDVVDDWGDVGQALAGAGAGGQDIIVAPAGDFDGAALMPVKPQRSSAPGFVMQEYRLALGMQVTIDDGLTHRAAAGEARIELNQRIGPKRAFRHLFFNVAADSSILDLDEALGIFAVSRDDLLSYRKDIQTFILRTANDFLSNARVASSKEFVQTATSHAGWNVLPENPLSQWIGFYNAMSRFSDMVSKIPGREQPLPAVGSLLYGQRETTPPDVLAVLGSIQALFKHFFSELGATDPDSLIQTGR